MFFQKRLERARETQRYLGGLDKKDEEGKTEEQPLDGAEPAEEEISPAEAAARRERRLKRYRKAKYDGTVASEVEKGDVPAMFAAGFLTVFLPAVLVLVAFVLLIFLIFGLF